MVVQFRTKPGQRDAFLAAIRAHVALSLASEPGCERLDVLLPQDDPDRVILFELYSDEAAFAAHGATPRLAAVKAAYQPLIESRTADVCSP